MSENSDLTNGNDPGTLASQALDAWKKREPQKADALLSQAIQGVSANSPKENVARVARVLRVMQQPQKALSLLDSIQIETCPHCQLERARAHVALKQWEPALESMERAKQASTPALVTTICGEHIRLLARCNLGREARLVAHEALSVNPASQAIRCALAFLTRIEQSTALPTDKDRYWEGRKEYVYLHVAQSMFQILGASARTALDVGSAGTPTVLMFPADRRYSVDWGNPCEHEGVIAHNCNYLEWERPEPIDIASCMQVLEHVPDPRPFAKKLLRDAEVVIASVPHLERPRANPGHIHSMITPTQFAGWFDREPNYLYIAQELSGDERMVAIWDTTTESKFGDLSKTGAVAESFKFRWSLRGSGVCAEE